MKTFATVYLCEQMGNRVQFNMEIAESEEELRKRHDKRDPKGFWKLMSVTELPDTAYHPTM